MSDKKEQKKIIAPPEDVPVDFKFEKLLKSFLRDVQKTGILREIRERRYYIKKSERKRLAKKKRRKR